MGFCEERGSGIDKVVIQTELFQLPAPIFEAFNESTRTVLFSYRDLGEMDKEEKIRACYLHSVLKHLNRQPMNNKSLRGRFGIEAKNSAIASRIIKQALEQGAIKPYDETAGAKAMRYVPRWA
jgi:predicted HTH transcriptional regulator